MILWAGPAYGPGRELLRMEKFLRDLAAAMELRDAALFVAADSVSGWGWLPLTATTDPLTPIRRFADEHDDAPYLAVGDVQHGLHGFRQSHLHAQDARRVAIAGSRIDRVTAVGDPGVAIAALLTEDINRTRDWVCDTLGPLAADTPGDGRLRETLRVFLREGSSYKAAAECLNLHHNSVRYRIERAIERRGRPIREDRIDVEVALRFCHRYGSSVLQS
jgi:DNA-binding PucR family transcriptional regulator